MTSKRETLRFLGTEPSENIVQSHVEVVFGKAELK
jgi:hypothetical protein